MALRPIPWPELDCVFLDAGNALVSIDFDWVAYELERLGLACAPDALRRAEAAARPAISRAVAERKPSEGTAAFVFYLQSVLARLDAASALGAPARAELAARLASVLREPGTQRLWSAPMPRIFKAALAEARTHPERALHVGDLYAVDLLGARAAGLHALLLDPYGDWQGVDCERSRDVFELAERLRGARR